MRNLNIGVGTVAGAALGAGIGIMSSPLFNKSLLKKINDLDNELELSMSNNQLKLNDDLNKRSKDLSLLSEGSQDYKVLKIEVEKLKSNLLSTFRPNQMNLYKRLNALVNKVNVNTGNYGKIFAILGGLSGGIISSQLK